MGILIPKTEKRANGNDVSLNKLLQSRTQNGAVLDRLSESYRGKNSVNLKKVKLMLEEFGLAKDVMPRFQLYNDEGVRVTGEEESLLSQPLLADTSIMRESIVFITPPQPHVETIRTRGLTIKLVARRSSDGYVSKKKFDFVYLPHDYYDPCFFCYENPDNNPESSRAKLVPMKEVARPGLRKRQMSDTVDLAERKIIIRGDDHNI